MLAEATVIGCKLYSITSDPKTQMEGPEKEIIEKVSMKHNKVKALKKSEANSDRNKAITKRQKQK